MKNLISTTLFYFFSSAIFFSTTHAQTIEVIFNQKNCEKIEAITKPLSDSFAEEIGVTKKSMLLHGGMWSPDKGCSIFYSTPKGSFSCIFTMLLSSDNGSTTYAAGFGRCTKV